MKRYPLDARYIAKAKPVCHTCGAKATWRIMFEEDETYHFCTPHVPLSADDVINGACGQS